MLGTIGITPMALLKKELEFKTMFKIQFLAVLISSLCSIGMALEGFGYMSLVGKFISYTLIVSIGAFLMVDWKPKFIFSKFSNLCSKLFVIFLPFFVINESDVKPIMIFSEIEIAF